MANQHFVNGRRINFAAQQRLHCFVFRIVGLNFGQCRTEGFGLLQRKVGRASRNNSQGFPGKVRKVFHLASGRNRKHLTRGHIYIGKRQRFISFGRINTAGANTVHLSGSKHILYASAVDRNKADIHIQPGGKLRQQVNVKALKTGVRRCSQRRAVGVNAHGQLFFFRYLIPRRIRGR